ncbi:MAG: asparagine synthase (glutamine-hydrolyzing) [Bacteroidetes bacterium]|jgi:asparagine synthase (glutamine-hydrolysing)|nr:asparagine synthase (glutamine-hydrolyzing) [Bacteroidota bacterium]
MCGISGFIDFNKNSTQDILVQMSDVLVHRGPDGSGAEFYETSTSQVGLAHRRLSIIDLSERGKQPMMYKDLTITYNGEIYNFDEIKTRLQKLGHTFVSDSDTEMILHAYSEWGADCLQHFIGMFAIAIYDNAKQEVFIARDRAGIKPLYYYLHDKLFLFASELKAFHKHPGFKKVLNTNAVAAFMQFGNVPVPHCIFQHCLKLKPGHFLKINTSTMKTETTCYWSVYSNAYNRKKIDISFEEAKTKTEELLESSFNYRMVADVPVGVFLSGGYDSVCVTSLLQKNRSEKIKTFTISVPDIGLNEAAYAADIARHLGTEHHELHCSEAEVLEIINHLPFYYDEPFADSSAIPTTLVSKMARQHVTVALSGDGGDESFAGYNRYDYLMKHGKFLKQIPGPLRSTMSAVMKKVPAEKIPVAKNKYNFPNRYNKLRMLLNDPSPENMMMSLSVQFLKNELDMLFKEAVVVPPTVYSSKELSEETYTPLSYMMAVDYQTYLHDDILQKVDRASMSASLEAREPFLDHRIIELAATLPDQFKYNKGIKKFMIREIVHGYVPKKMMDRPKMGFAIPIEKWLTHELKETVNHFLNDNIIKNQGIFNAGYIHKLKGEFFSGKTEHHTKIWYLLMFQMWYEKWMK